MRLFPEAARHLIKAGLRWTQWSVCVRHFRAGTQMDPMAGFDSALFRGRGTQMDPMACPISRRGIFGEFSGGR